MKLIVGLGNPGRKYEGTRHNIGFDVVAELARRQAGSPAGATFRKGFQGETADGNLGGERLLLLRPHTFMNRSGSSVVEARDFYKLTNADLLIVCDDLNLPFGKLRIRASGSSGGQKGLEDAIRCCGGEDVPRLRIGIGQPPERMDAADFVLAKFSVAERQEMGVAAALAADAAEMWVREGVAACMNRYN
jgi:PTH1 family peptidyl-tRNA hydrolase